MPAAAPQPDSPPTEETTRSAPPQGRSLPERVTLLVSLAVVASLIGFIAWHGLFVQRGKPAVQVRVLVRAAWQQAGRGGWTVPVEIRSVCDVPLENVQVTVEMTTRAGDRADVTVEAAYLAERASEEVFVLSELPPKDAGITARVESFKARRDARGY